MANKGRKRCAYVNEEQKNLIIEFMRKHPELNSGKFSATFTYKHAQKLWEEVTAELHEIPGAQKEWKQWRKTWQDMRSSTKAKSASIKNHEKKTGGGPASSEILTKIDQNVLVLMGTTVVEGHKTVQESNAQIEWIDDSILHETDDNSDNNEKNSPMTYKGNTQYSVPKQSLPFQIYNCDIMEENYSSNENLKNNSNEIYNDNRKLAKIKTTALETPSCSNTVVNRSHNPLTPIPKSITIKKGTKRTSVAQRYDESIEQTEKLAKIS